MWQDILKNEKKMKKITQTAFKAIDVNNNELIEKEELQEIMSTTADDLGIERPAKQEIKDVMKQLDSSNKGYLSKDDFNLLTQQVIKLINKAQQI